jgi:hypothetical protein
MPRRIVACGGEQLSFPALTGYVLELTAKPRPKIRFVSAPKEGRAFRVDASGELPLEVRVIA